MSLGSRIAGLLEEVFDSLWGMEVSHVIDGVYSEMQNDRAIRFFHIRHNQSAILQAAVVIATGRMQYCNVGRSIWSAKVQYCSVGPLSEKATLIMNKLESRPFEVRLRPLKGLNRGYDLQELGPI